jgi:hypothetical protein
MPLGVILMIGIGDGYPPIGMKVAGAAVLIVGPIGGLILAGSVIAALVLTLRDNRKSLWIRMGVAFFTLLFTSAALFGVWLFRKAGAAKEAIISGNVFDYDEAVRWRFRGNLEDDLWLAASWGRLRMVKHLIEKGARPDAPGRRDIFKAAEENLGKQPNHNEGVIEFLRTNQPARSDP